jgi:YVTN family beta-propeller protein
LVVGAGVLAPVGSSASSRATWTSSGPDADIKIESRLAVVDRVTKTQGETAGLEEARHRGLTVVDKKIRVVIESASKEATAGHAAAASNGGSDEAEYNGDVQALLPPGRLRSAAHRDDVRYVRPPASWRETAVTDEGVSSANAALTQVNGNLGAGVSIAIIDGGFAGYTARQATGDLPSNLVTVGTFCSDYNATDHGTAVAEIAHDMAPRALLYLICIDSEVTLGNAKDYVKSHGIKIVSHSIAWYNSSRGDGSGGGATPDAIVKDARNNGILWVNAAGNDGQSHWNGTFNDPDNNGALNFSGSDQTNNVTIPGGAEPCFFLKWDLWPHTNQDFDLFIYEGGVAPTPSNFLDRSGQAQTGTQPPADILCFFNSGATRSFGLLIGRISGQSNPRFDLFANGLDLQFRTGGSVVEPASSPYAMAVGAICWKTGGLEPYSARGPTIDGRKKPDVVAADSVSTATYGPFGSTGSCGSIDGFAGTSAATPHVSGAAALVKAANPTFTAAQLQSYLERRALDLGTGGKDNLYGSGRLWLRAFTDVPTSDYAYSSIEFLYGAGITTGCSYTASTADRQYCPSGLVTRAEMAPFLVKSMGLGPCTTCTTQTFTDVPKSYWAYQWIEQLVKQGITSGCSTSPRKYCPSGLVTRAQMAPFLMKAAGVGQCNSCTTQTFTDVPKSYWAYRWIEQLVKLGVTSGCSTQPKKYCPESSVTRRDMAIFLVRSFHIAAADGPFTFAPVAGDLYDLVFSPDGQSVYATNPSQNRVEVFDVQTGAFEGPIAVGSQPKGLDVTADGSTLYVANSGSTTISVVDVTTKTETKKLAMPCSGCSDHPFSIAIANNGKAFFSTTFAGSGFGGRLFELDLGGETFTQRVDGPFSGATTKLTRLAASGDDTKIGISYGSDSGGTIASYSAVGNNFTTHAVSDFIDRIAVNATGTQYLVNSANLSYVLDGSLSLGGSTPGGGLGSAFAPTGTTAYRTRVFGIESLDTATFAISGALPIGDTVFAATGALATSPDGSVIAVVTDNGLSIVLTS